MSAGSLARQRRAARLAAVQALYQMEISGASPASVIQDYFNGSLPQDEHGTIAEDSDGEHFRLIVELAVSRQERIDQAIAKRLSEGWRLERIDSVARAILRAGVVELQARADIPTAVVIDEYVEVAKAFFDGPEPAFINATLDSVAKDVRD
jgi:N utilization substance protein B